jgi:predicted RNA-binding protein with PIN domain
VDGAGNRSSPAFCRGWKNPLGNNPMPYLIDGHNLIGAFPGLSLADPQDEHKLAEILSRYAARKRRRITVFFDGGQVGGGTPHLGLVSLRFITPPRTADDAILSFLRRERNPSAYTVVTSDSQLADHIRALGAQVIDSRSFSQVVFHAQSRGKPENTPDTMIDLDEWLRLFGEEKNSRP